MTVIAGLHYVDLPLWAAQLWRAGNFLLAVLVLAAAWVFLRTEGKPSRRWLMAGLALAVLRSSIVIPLEHWRQPVALERTPVNTAWLLLAAAGLRLWVRGD